MTVKENPEKLFFTADTHFGHTNILKYCNRPFSTRDVHDAALIKNWNQVVPPKGTVYHLGDFALCTMGRTENIREQLNGTIHLIYGNHRSTTKRLKHKFGSVQNYLEIKVMDEEMDIEQVIVLCHYPFESWNKMHHGSWHLHGHCHGTLPSGDHQARVDVGVDSWDYKPVSYEQIKEHMTYKVFKPIDHHGRV